MDLYWQVLRTVLDPLKRPTQYPSAEVFVSEPNAKNIASHAIGVYSLVTGKANGNSALDRVCASHHFLSLPRFRVALGERKNLC
jgi:hypothetical protein